MMQKRCDPREKLKGIKVYGWDGTIEEICQTSILQKLSKNDIAAVVIPKFFQVGFCENIVKELTAPSSFALGKNSLGMQARYGLSRHTVLVAAHNNGLKPYSVEWFEFINNQLTLERSKILDLEVKFKEGVSEIFGSFGYSCGQAIEQTECGTFTYGLCGVRVFAPQSEDNTLCLHHDRISIDGYLSGAGIDVDDLLNRSSLKKIVNQFALNVPLQNTGGGRTIIFNGDLVEIKRIFNTQELAQYRRQGGYSPQLIEDFCKATGREVERFALESDIGSLTIFNSHNPHTVEPQILDSSRPDVRRIRLHSFVGLSNEIYSNRDPISEDLNRDLETPHCLLFI